MAALSGIGPPPVVTLRGFDAPLPVRHQLHVSPVDTIIQFPQPPLPAVPRADVPFVAGSTHYQNFPQQNISYPSSNPHMSSFSTFPYNNENFAASSQFLSPPSPTRLSEAYKVNLSNQHINTNNYANDVHVANQTGRASPGAAVGLAPLRPVAITTTTTTVVAPMTAVDVQHINTSAFTAAAPFTDLYPKPLNVNALTGSPEQQHLRLTLEWGPTGEQVQHYWYSSEGILPRNATAGPSVPHDDTEMIDDVSMIIRGVGEGLPGDDGAVPDKGRVTQFVAAVGQHYGPKTRLTRKGDLDDEGMNGLPTIEEVFLLGQLFWPEHVNNLSGLVLYADGGVFDYLRGDIRCMSAVGLQQPLVLAPRGWRRPVPLTGLIARFKDALLAKVHGIRGTADTPQTIPAVPHYGSSTHIIADPYAAPIIVVDDSRGGIRGPPTVAYATTPHFTHTIEHSTMQYPPGSPAMSPATGVRFAPPPSPSTFEPTGM